ncbi:hypothetical protein CN943_21890 [Bacillus thuringiensis]|nr:hypothetical protein [Bacillus thuringiensis]PGL92404.1 hypothetical protein CN943_21890 [Bacillus thuringiensis]
MTLTGARNVPPEFLNSGLYRKLLKKQNSFYAFSKKHLSILIFCASKICLNINYILGGTNIMANISEVVVREALDRFFDSTAKGNEGHADVEEVNIDGTMVSFKVQIVHKHTQRILRNKITVYSLTTHVEGKFDILNPNESDLVYNIETPVGGMQVSLADTVKVLADLAKA